MQFAHNQFSTSPHATHNHTRSYYPALCCAFHSGCSVPDVLCETVKTPITRCLCSMCRALDRAFLQQEAGPRAAEDRQGEAANQCFWCPRTDGAVVLIPQTCRTAACGGQADAKSRQMQSTTRALENTESQETKASEGNKPTRRLQADSSRR